MALLALVIGTAVGWLIHWQNNLDRGAISKRPPIGWLPEDVPAAGVEVVDVGRTRKVWPFLAFVDEHRRDQFLSATGRRLGEQPNHFRASMSAIEQARRLTRRLAEVHSPRNEDEWIGVTYFSCQDNQKGETAIAVEVHKLDPDSLAALANMVEPEAVLSNPVLRRFVK